jgi:hypothetical protein
MAPYIKPSKILEDLRLIMPVTLTLEDPLTRAPITIAYENLHSLLVVDVENLTVEGQLVANLYAEMARFQRAAEFAADRADIRYVKWKAAKEDAFRAAARRARPEEPPAEAEADGKKTKTKAKPAASPKVTVAEAEAAYRTDADYESMSEEPKRLRAIAGLFEDLKWGFRMKSEQMRDTARTIGGYGASDRDGDIAAGVEREPRRSPGERLADYVSLAEEASALASASGSSQRAIAMLSGNPQQPSQQPPPKRSASPVE